MKTTVPLLVAAALLVGCGKKNPEQPVEPPAQKPEVAGTTSGSIGGAPKRTIDDAQARIDAVQKKESAAAEEVR